MAIRKINEAKIERHIEAAFASIRKDIKKTLDYCSFQIMEEVSKSIPTGSVLHYASGEWVVVDYMNRRVRLPEKAAKYLSGLDEIKLFQASLNVKRSIAGVKKDKRFAIIKNQKSCGQ